MYLDALDGQALNLNDQDVQIRQFGLSGRPGAQFGLSGRQDSSIALDAHVAGTKFGRSGRPDLSIWTLWTSRFVNMDALDDQTLTPRRSIWTL